MGLNGPVGFVGFGRFGRALLEIFAEGGRPGLAWDPSADVPKDVAASSLEGLSSSCPVIFVAVPVASMGDVFRELKPLVGPDHLVADVGSVKVHPSREMAEIFGERTPWVATHPLFGPVSLARAEPDLRAVVCPNSVHPAAVAEIQDLYRSIGCRIIDLEPEAHDRIMAQTHALAFFIAKGMLDAGVPTDSPAAPPSFQAMARTIESVRGDAGHLITTLHRENPYAADYRRRMLAALASLDRRLNETSDSDPSQGEPALSIPATSHLPELSETRERIDEVDREIVQLLVRRAELVRRARHHKAAAGRGVVDPAREEAMLRSRARWADEAHLDPDGVAAIFEAVIALSCEIQARGT